jgi:hypothetical protein
VSRRRRNQTDELPIREELEALARHYHHLQAEHQNAGPESGLRRRIEERLLDVRGRFDRTLEEWVAEPELRDEWRAYLEHHASEPSGPSAIRQVVFRGRSEAASVIEVRQAPDGLEVWIDGTLAERLIGDKGFATTAAPHRAQLDGTWFDEFFEASPEALDALAGFLDGGGQPPWSYARELLEDGLIDVHFAVTPRGRRGMAQARPA